ncbi:polysaccharide biosynthesis tyrosine autokinase [Bradyrhizobium japonicum]|uniref:polysaccharide biosynthesis tyrosine autokinase n=1 Tax=Bradyrhizobium japonicum TaxID=375 RepID=UPI001BA62650|nr:polysaccharide biosynthesis tyrosine autokinase [Bradyrhizobium japonicum]MBR0749937.1 polysaccharide biosynthesis tyrosine autokinase [Bradyrhizobium japonicum]
MDASTKLQPRDRAFSHSTTDMNDSISQILEKVFGVLRRQWWIFAAVTPCCIVLGVAYLLTASATFTAHTQLLIDTSNLKVLQQRDSSDIERPIDTAQVESQVEIIRSRDLASSVIKSQNLDSDPEFVGAGTRALSRIIDLFGEGEPASREARSSEALNTFLKKRWVARVGQTYVLDVGFSSTDPARAATLSNALAEAYINSQLEAKFQAVRRASGWLQDRMKELRQQALDADQAVLSYKEKNSIVNIGSAFGGGPRLIGEQQIEELNTQLSNARAAAAEANARLARIDEVLKQDIPDATVTDTLRNEVITRLRNNYLDLAAREATWSTQYGPEHQAVVSLRTQMLEIRKSIRDELGRIAQSYKSDAEIANTRIDGLEKSLERLISNSQAVNRDRLGLKDLESRAQAYHTIYDTFLKRYTEAIQQQSFPITESRIISTAEIPTRKSSPNTIIVLALSTILGLMLSAVASVVRESTDRVLRTTDQVESFFNVACLAKVPALPLLASPSRRPQFSIEQARRSSAVGPQHLRTISNQTALMRNVIDDPLSAFAEAFRSIKVAVDMDSFDQRSRVVGITSALPAEGKSTISSNFAQAIAFAGKRVILIDGDLRNPSLTRTLAPDAEVGVLQVLQGSLSLDQALHHDPETGLAFLPAIVPPRHARSNEILASAGFAQMIRQLRESYDYVIVDFSPIAPIVDVRAAAHLVDSLLFVVEWAQTNKNLILQELRAAPEVSEKMLGMILNKVNMKALSRFESHYAGSYFAQYYGQ